MEFKPISKLNIKCPNCETTISIPCYKELTSHVANKEVFCSLCEENLTQYIKDFFQLSKNYNYAYNELAKFLDSYKGIVNIEHLD